MSESNHDFLKRVTHSQHQLTEASPPFIRLFSLALSLQDYRRILYGWHLVLTFANKKTNLFLDNDQCSLTWLENDLSSLGHESPLLHMEIPDNELQIQDSAQAWGCYYVLQGSQLGNQVLCKRLISNVKTKNWPREFYTGRGLSTRQHWEAFCSELNNLSLNSEQRQSMALSAIGTFKLIEKTIRMCLEQTCLKTEV